MEEADKEGTGKRKTKMNKEAVEKKTKKWRKMGKGRGELKVVEPEGTTLILHGWMGS